MAIRVEQKAEDDPLKSKNAVKVGVRWQHFVCALAVTVLVVTDVMLTIRRNAPGHQGPRGGEEV